MITLLGMLIGLLIRVLKSDVFTRNRHVLSIVVKERYAPVSIDVDLRCDSQKNSPMKHEPKLAKVCFSGNVNGVKVNALKDVSLELFAQLTDPRICSTLEPRELVKERVKACAARFDSINMNRFSKSQDIVNNTVIMTMWWFDIIVRKRADEKLVF